MFFTTDEAEKIEALNRNGGRAAPVSPYDIRLDAIIYYAPESWILWLQGTKWTPQTIDADIRIISVTENEVQLLWQGEGVKTPKKIALKPHQIFRATSGLVSSTSN